MPLVCRNPIVYPKLYHILESGQNTSSCFYIHEAGIQ